jgi:hypothetical protein
MIQDLESVGMINFLHFSLDPFVFNLVSFPKN